MNIKNYLTGWEFVYNAYTGKWMATTRDNHQLLYNDYSNKKVLKSSSIDTLQAIIIKMKGEYNQVILDNLK